jgi:hypothetical protein
VPVVVEEVAAESLSVTGIATVLPLLVVIVTVPE